MHFIIRKYFKLRQFFISIFTRIAASPFQRKSSYYFSKPKATTTIFLRCSDFIIGIF